MDLKTIRIRILIEFTTNPPILSYQKYLVAIYSPNIIQKVSELDYFSFREKSMYQCKYSQMLTHFLYNGFESNCDEYDIRNEYGEKRA